MAKFPYCSCGGLKIDNDTLQVNPATGHLYAAGAVTGDNILAYDYVNQAYMFVNPKHLQITPIVNMMAYSASQDFAFLCLPVSGASQNYSGKWRIILLPKASGLTKPTTIHVIISAQGF